MRYLNRIHNIYVFSTEIAVLFTSVCDSPKYQKYGSMNSSFTSKLFQKFEVDCPEIHDEIVYPKLIDYFKNKLIPHKIAVYHAGLELNEKEWFNELEIDREQFIENLWLHDLSKFSAIESVPYSQHDFSKNEFSPEMKIAWIHHKNHNEHHPEYWLNPSKSGQLDPLPMPDIYILEMVADWIGAGRTYENELENWLPDNLRKFLWHNETSNKVKFILEKLGFSIDQRGSVLYVNSKENFK